MLNPIIKRTIIRHFSRSAKRLNATPGSGNSSSGTSGLLYALGGAGVAGLGFYFYQKSNTANRGLSNLATAASVLSHENPDYPGSLFQATSEHKGKADYQEVYNAIAEKIGDEDEYDGGIGYGPILVRMAWHASGSYDKNDHSDKKGGNYGGTMEHKYEANDPANSGLVKARNFLSSIQKKFDWISRGDLYTLAGVTAIQEMSGPKINWRPGRKNLGDSYQPPHGRLPDASQGATHIREVFTRLHNFSDEETAALIGVGHALGRCHKANTGYDGPWTFSPNLVTNEFFKLILDEKWQIKDWDGQTQFEDVKTKSLMMLPTDFALVFDPKFRKISREYAKDQDKLFKDFAAAFTKLLEGGIEFPKGQEYWQFKTLDEQNL